ncbi:MAG TPA: hypothetical protein VNJ04_07855 [Gemmatimonadaceae bacterium]|nr:hypothetical protein [Gemmatimonadaceae bacterium]
MSAITLSTKPRVRLLAFLACVLSLSIAVFVTVGLQDGGWPLLVPAVGAAAVIVWPVRSVLAVAILLNAAIIILGLMTVGILYGFSLAALLFALAALRPANHQEPPNEELRPTATPSSLLE